MDYIVGGWNIAYSICQIQSRKKIWEGNGTGEKRTAYKVFVRKYADH
jgi:hypothetical protein